MLSDAAIDRYARQIVLPEVGGRGQERLLAARVGVFAASANADAARETAVYTALHLAVAGVGELAMARELAAEAAPAVAARNPETMIVDATTSVDATVVIGDASALAEGMPTVLGGVGRTGVVAVLPASRCRSCALASLPPLEPPSAWPPLTATLLAPLLATLVLRELLGIGERETATLIVLGLEGASAVTSPIARRPGCSCC